MSELAQWLTQGPWPIDGGLSGELENLGHDLSDDLWSARLLRDSPESIAQVHRQYVEAGARVIITASYQASRRGFMSTGLTDIQADALIAQSIVLAREVADSASSKVWVAASVGPYGAVLGGGEEYIGNYGVSHDDLVTFHRERIEVLAAAGPDLFACETIPDIVEVKALLEVLADYPHIPAWITMSCADGDFTCAGQPISELALVTRDHDNVVAIGANCTMPQHISQLFSTMREHTVKPFVVYPNAGRLWDPDNHVWIGEPRHLVDPESVREWALLGSAMIGGCCGLGPRAVRAIDVQLDELRQSSAQ